MNTSGLLGGGVAGLSDLRSVLIEKASMRERILAERRGRDARARETHARDLASVAMEQPEITSARCLAAYASTSEAPGTWPLRRALRAGGVQVLLPVLLDDGTLDWLRDGEAVPRRTPTAPTGTVPATAEQEVDLLGLDRIAWADVLVVPALAVDSLGNRLGPGDGFYDRTLRRLDPTVTVFAMCFDSEVLDAAVEAVPVGPHDRPVDAVITPTRCLRLPPRQPS